MQHKSDKIFCLCRHLNPDLMDEWQMHKPTLPHLHSVIDLFAFLKILLIKIFSIFKTKAYFKSLVLMNIKKMFQK
jgi:hypothetical protein